MGIKVLSLFDGISCGMIALERAGITVDRYVAYEVDKYAISVSERNYPMIEHCGDVFGGNFYKYKGFDLLLGGSPCTYWSIAKKGREIAPDGIGGQLFAQYVRALKESECKYFLYENNYSIHKDIQEYISDQLEVSPIMINSALVSAQNRKRLYWTNIPVGMMPIDQNIRLQDILESGMATKTKSYCMTASYHKVGNTAEEIIHDAEKHIRSRVYEPIRIGTVEGKGQSREWRIYSVKGKSISICGCAGGGGAKTRLYKVDLPDGDYIIRKLTPTEAERLQTLPDGYTEGISDTQRYKCIGNGWTVDVIAHILKSMKA